MNSAALRDALREFMAAAESKDAARIGPALNRVLEFESQLGPDADPHLRHYLQRRSYQKALDYLTGQPPAAGACGERH